MTNNIDKIVIKVPEDAEWIIHRLKDAGYEAYAVGGCVRDSLLGRIPDDWDITTSALPEQVKSLFRSTVDTGLQHGTVTVIKNGVGYEVTTYRKDGEYLDGRHPESVYFTGALEDDLMRRDFTINAMAYNAEYGLVDLFGGISDLEKKLVRAVGNPDDRFNEDALRIMRAIRFSAQLGFKIETETFDAIANHANNLSKVSMERIRVEFEKTLMSSHQDYIYLFGKLGIGRFIVPDFEERCFGINEERHICLLNSIPKNKELRLTAFLCEMNPDEAHAILRKLTYDNKTNDMVKKIIRYKNTGFAKDRRKIKLLLHQMGAEVFEKVLNYKECELIAFGAEEKASGEELFTTELLARIKDEYADIMRKEEPFAVNHLAIGGSRLLEWGIPKGEAIGLELEELTLRVIDDPKLNTQENLYQIVKERAELYG